jgi:iron complex transport system ATP-binding protein
VIPVIRLQDATVVRDGRAILDHVDVEIRSGQRWAILGPNGAGKTTMLDLMSAQSHPTSGAVEVLGQPLGLVDVFELRPLIGVLSHRTARRLPDDEKVRDVIMTAGWAVSGRYWEEYDDVDLKRCDELLYFLGLTEFAGRRLGTLSDGERKKVLLARALFPNPELLLMDEPASGLDVGAREGLLNRLSAIAGDPTAPVQVLITHHVEEIPSGFTHALLLRRGKVLAAGPVDEVITDESLSETFDTPLLVRKVFSRFWAFGA